MSGEKLQLLKQAARRLKETTGIGVICPTPRNGAITMFYKTKFVRKCISVLLYGL